MTRDKINGRRLVGLFLLGLLLFNFPLLSLFNRPVLVFGIPLFYLYLFGVWSVMILLMIVISLARSEPSLTDEHG
ncbi:conserved hypothetical protein [Desulfosarcina cetonica]|uniref:hypothetical protein n=1 Tax=Desulfosarcina cetonica TaxID=90730 RepID=UPI0006D07FB6|nr:hypothetical protein [Desulfosarcina cetonica]VTR64926.1 conserved hypothetical protein [Desulfosarcina cetonica]